MAPYLRLRRVFVLSVVVAAAASSRNALWTVGKVMMASRLNFDSNRRCVPERFGVGFGKVDSVAPPSRLPANLTPPH
jgi:hypothetical protein